jgi:competence ComEA-like helix-hairpin-helix protein
MTDSSNDHRNHAGPYGFTRREIAFLTGIIAICIAVIVYDSWRDSRRPQTPAWVIEDVLVEAPASTPSFDSTSAQRGDTSSVRATRDDSDLIDVNTADARELARLPGIGPELARRIIAEREDNGSFVSLIDLQRVKGIGPRKAAMLSGWIKFSAPTTQSDSLEKP